jgi:hypothetical protein
VCAPAGVGSEGSRPSKHRENSRSRRLAAASKLGMTNGLFVGTGTSSACESQCHDEQTKRDSSLCGLRQPVAGRFGMTSMDLVGRYFAWNDSKREDVSDRIRLLLDEVTF